jgi:serine/threonine protein kinase
MSDTLSRLETNLSGRYAIEREIGRGGMAVVYLAQDLKHGRSVAIKVLLPELAHAIGPTRFLREIEIAAQLTHPNILPLHDSGDADGLLYYVMPYVEGESLRQRMTRERQLPIEEAIGIIRDVADALTYAHENGVIHRDIKPENILLAAGRPVVTDFGIARAADRDGIGDRNPALHEPRAGDRGRGDRRADRCLQSRVYRLRAPRRRGPLQRLDAAGGSDQGIERSATPSPSPPAGRPGGDRTGGRAGSGEGAGGSLRQRGGIRAGAGGGEHGAGDVGGRAP